MTRTEISRAVTKARIKQRKSRYQICKETGMAHHQLKNVEEGQVNYTIDSLVNLCQALGLKIKIY